MEVVNLPVEVLDKVVRRDTREDDSDQRSYEHQAEPRMWSHAFSFCRHACTARPVAQARRAHESAARADPSRVFLAVTGMTPSRFRRVARATSAPVA